MCEVLKNVFNVSKESKEKFPTYLEDKLLEYTNFFQSQPYKMVHIKSLSFYLSINYCSLDKILEFFIVIKKWNIF